MSAGLATIITVLVGLASLVRRRPQGSGFSLLETWLMLVLGPVAAVVVRLAAPTPPRQRHIKCPSHLKPLIPHLLRPSVLGAARPSGLARGRCAVGVPKPTCGQVKDASRGLNWRV